MNAVFEAICFVTHFSLALKLMGYICKITMAFENCFPTLSFGALSLNLHIIPYYSGTLVPRMSDMTGHTFTRIPNRVISIHFAHSFIHSSIHPLIDVRLRQVDRLQLIAVDNECSSFVVVSFSY